MLFERVLHGYEQLQTTSIGMDYAQSLEPHLNGVDGGVGGGGGGGGGDSDGGGGDGGGGGDNSNFNGITDNSESQPPQLPPPPLLTLPHLAAIVNVAVTWKKLGLHLVKARDMFERALRGYEHTPAIGWSIFLSFP